MTIPRNEFTHNHVSPAVPLLLYRWCCTVTGTCSEVVVMVDHRQAVFITWQLGGGIKKQVSKKDRRRQKIKPQQQIIWHGAGPVKKHLSCGCLLDNKVSRAKMFHISRLSSKICTDAADHALGWVLLALTMKSNFFTIKYQIFYSMTKLFGYWITEGHTDQQT